MKQARVLDGKVAIVTGAARGMGASMARLFASQGATVIAADIQDRPGTALAEADSNITYRHLDVTSESEWLRAVQDISERHGKIDVLVNNAAIQHKALLTDLTLEAYNAVVQVNQVGVFLGMKAVVPSMKSAVGGSIINMSSRAGLVGIPQLTAYAASKFAIRGMTKVAALELARFNIRVNTVLPSLTDTPLIQTGSLAEQAARAASTPFGRAARPEEIAQLVLFLASDAASYCSGGDYTCDGAISAGAWRG